MLRITDSGKVQGAVATQSESYITGVTTLSTGVWHSVCLTYDGTNINLYVNGAANAAPVAKSEALNTATDVAEFGKEAADGEYWDGYIDDARIYTEALTLAQVQSLHNTPTEAE
jgi:hypothetical protein